MYLESIKKGHPFGQPFLLQYNKVCKIYFSKTETATTPGPTLATKTGDA